MAEWHDEPLDKRRVCQKRRRRAACPPQLLDTLPAEQRELLKRWVKHGGNSRWGTLLTDAGVNRVTLALSLLDWLLKNGWAAVIQQWEHSDWQPQRVEFLDLPKLRAALGLRDKDADAQRWQEVRASLQLLNDTSLAPAVFALDDMPLRHALARHDLILKLHDWHSQHRTGTHRDFALFARNDTKAVNDSELDWLESVFDLAEFGIKRHTPLLLIAAPLRLQMPQGQLELAACPDFAALTPDTLQAMTAAFGTVVRWQLVENRTSFERTAKNREADTGVIWLPGFPPTWWREAIGYLLDLAPAPAQIACDPDPAGILITLKAAELWYERKLDWQPWRMSTAELAALTSRKPLSETDRVQLASLQATPTLPSMLAELAAWMAQYDEKGEQEGYL